MGSKHVYSWIKGVTKSLKTDPKREDDGFTISEGGVTAIQALGKLNIDVTSIKWWKWEYALDECNTHTRLETRQMLQTWLSQSFPPQELRNHNISEKEWWIQHAYLVHAPFCWSYPRFCLLIFVWLYLLLNAPLFLVPVPQFLWL